MIISFGQYLPTAPLYINVLNVYAVRLVFFFLSFPTVKFANVHNIS